MTHHRLSRAALASLGITAFAAASPCTAAPTPTPTHLIAVKVIQGKFPDITFKEVQFSFPALKVSFHIAPLAGPGKTGHLALIETSEVAPGTPVGPGQPTGAPGVLMAPLAVSSCLAPVKMVVRVWVSNVGNADFNATDTSLGLDGIINNAQTVTSAFGVVGAGQDKYFEVGPYSFVPGGYPMAFALNKSQKGNEVNFKNNYFQGSFDILCKSCPAGQVVDVSSGQCKRAPKPVGPGKP